MSAKRGFLVVIGASIAVLSLVASLRVIDTVRAEPPAKRAEVAGLTIPYPGKLTDKAGLPAADGAYDLSFVLYGVEEGGVPLWSEVQEEVSVRGGSFFTSLGQVAGIPEELMHAGTRWLAVSVRGPGESEFTRRRPRLRVDAAGSKVRSSTSNSMACPHDHFGEHWQGDHSQYLLYLQNTGTGDGLTAHTDCCGAAVRGSTADGVGIEGYSGLGVAVMGTSSFGVAISARGTGQIWSSADSGLFLSPHDMVARENDPSVLDVISLDNGGVRIVNQSGTNVTRYASLPVSTFGTLFESNIYVKELYVCYKAPSPSTYIGVTAVIKNDGAEAAEFYIINQQNRTSDTHDCYTLTADPRVRISNSSWVQFNVRFSGVGSEIYIYTVKLTLTQESS